jgi:hypothetical protein
MNIVALCKTFRGQEWIKPMTMSIYPYIKNIVFINSEISWTGRQGNLCKDHILELMQTLPDGKNGKIISLDHDTIDQFEQCMVGYNYIKENLEADIVMLIDTDEVWNDHDLQVCIDYIKRHPNHSTYKNNVYTYIKSPLYRVSPPEPLEPVSFVQVDLPDLGKHARACDLPTQLILDEGDENKRLFYHHYVYVRDEFNTVLEKIITSHASEHRYYQDMGVWIPEVWNSLPYIQGHWKEGFHPAIGFKVNWKDLDKIKRSQMPRVLRENNFPILRKFGIIN